MLLTHALCQTDGRARLGADLATTGSPTTAQAKRGFLSPFVALRDTNFRWYWISGLGVAGGQGITQFAITWLVIDLTGSVASLGLVVLAQGFPMTLISLFGGVLADRY